MKKKRVISAMLAGVMCTGATVALAGCSSNYEPQLKGRGLDGRTVYILMESKDEKILHKGKFTPVIYSANDTWCTYSGPVGCGLIDLNLNCGKKWLTNADCYITEYMPAQEDYDVVCEDCMGLN